MNQSFMLSRISEFSGEYNEMEIPMSIGEYEKAFRRWKGGEMIQNVFPNLSPEVREFIMSGITPAEWAEMFGSEDEANG